MKIILILLGALVSAAVGADQRLDDVDMDDEVTSSHADVSEPKMEDRIHAALLAAMRRPDVKKKMGEVLPIIRVMSPSQRLTLAALLTSQIMNNAAPSYNEVAAMFGVDPNAPEDVRRKVTSSLLLPISYDIARMFKGGHDKEIEPEEAEEELPAEPAEPEAQEYRYLRPSSPRQSFRRPPPGQNRRNAHIYAEMRPPPPPPPGRRKQVSNPQAAPDADHCQFFSDTVCLEVSDYPKEAIISSLRATEDSLDEFLAPETESSIANNIADLNENRRQDGAAPASMCSSTTQLARPKRARTTAGSWKYIVNTGHYTQTLRLEMCRNPQHSCSYISDSFQSQCAQVYNYHRLLTWDEDKGLHMDIFKVPTCCSCQVRGYAANFPPVKSGQLPLHPDHYPGVEIAVDNNFAQTQNDHQYIVHGSPFQGPFSDQPLDESHLLRQGAVIEPSRDTYTLHGHLASRPVAHEQLFNTHGLVRRPYDGGAVSNLKKRGNELDLSLVPPPHRPVLPHHGYTDNNIRREDNRTHPEGVVVAPHVEEVIRGSPGARSPVAPSRPSTTEHQGGVYHRNTPQYDPRPVHEHTRPSVHDQTRPSVHDQPRPSVVATPRPRPHDNEFVASPPAKADAGNTKTEGQKVNYNYHPIIDFFKARGSSAKLESRTGEGWTPIVGSKE